MPEEYKHGILSVLSVAEPAASDSNVSSNVERATMGIGVDWRIWLAVLTAGVVALYFGM